MSDLYEQARAFFPNATEILNERNHIHVGQRGYGRVPYYGRKGTM